MPPLEGEAGMADQERPDAPSANPAMCVMERTETVRALTSRRETAICRRVSRRRTDLLQVTDSSVPSMRNAGAALVTWRAHACLAIDGDVVLPATTSLNGRVRRHAEVFGAILLGGTIALSRRPDPPSVGQKQSTTPSTRCHWNRTAEASEPVRALAPMATNHE
jgi:hypothetical protein